MAHEHDAHGDNYDVHAHITPTSTNLIVFVVLLFFTGLTVAAYNVRLGEWNLIVAVVIATIKATLVGYYFMHLRHETRFNVAFFLAGLLFLGVFFVYTMNDTNYRNEIDPDFGVRRDARSGQFVVGTSPTLSEQNSEFGAIQPAGEGHAGHEPAAHEEGEGEGTPPGEAPSP
jgi:cytochrome c oxidase subunit 4